MNIGNLEKTHFSKLARKTPKICQKSEKEKKLFSKSSYPHGFEFFNPFWDVSATIRDRYLFRAVLAETGPAPSTPCNG